MPAGTYQINLNNATNCRVELSGSTIVAKQTAPATDVYSFFYAAPNYQTQIYYSTVPAGQNAGVIVGNGSPDMQPYPYDTIVLSSTTSGYYGPSDLEMSNVRGGLRGYNDWYIIQNYSSDPTSTYCTEHAPCLMVVPQNPCTTPSVATVEKALNTSHIYR